MQKTRSWQESFDRLEAARREERHLLEAEAKQLRDAEAAYAGAAARKAEKPAQPTLPLVSAKPDADALLVRPKRQSKQAAKPAPRKRSAARRTAANAQPKLAKPRAARQHKPAVAALPPSISQPADWPATPAELPPITPLPRNASLAPYRKTGLFGLIDSWLRIAKRQAASGIAAGVRRPELKPKPPAPSDEVAELRAENERLRRQLEALLVFPDNQARAN